MFFFLSFCLRFRFSFSRFFVFVFRNNLSSFKASLLSFFFSHLIYVSRRTSHVPHGTPTPTPTSLAPLSLSFLSTHHPEHKSMKPTKPFLFYNGPFPFPFAIMICTNYFSVFLYFYSFVILVYRTFVTFFSPENNNNINQSRENWNRCLMDKRCCENVPWIRLNNLKDMKKQQLLVQVTIEKANPTPV